MLIIFFNITKVGGKGEEEWEREIDDGRVDLILVLIGRMNKYVLALKRILGKEIEKVARDGK